jgi:hypothetical protein
MGIFKLALAQQVELHLARDLRENAEILSDKFSLPGTVEINLAQYFLLATSANT